MSRVVLLDAGPLGMLSHPRRSPESAAWLQRLLRAGTTVLVPEISDYEVRRELLRLRSVTGIRRLDTFKSTLGYVPLTTEAMLRAAEFWADARRRGRPTADPHALDGDMILAAQATTSGIDPVIATTNVTHLERYAAAQLWHEIH